MLFLESAAKNPSLVFPIGWIEERFFAAAQNDMRIDFCAAHKTAPYSYLSAVMGSTLVALRAGT